MARQDSTQATPPCYIRKIKTGRIMYEYRRKNQYPPQAIVPLLQIKGHWLHKAGFTINSAVTIQVMPGRLVLTTE